MRTYLQWCTFDARKTGRSIFTVMWTYFQQWRHHYLQWCGHIYDDALLALERLEDRYLQRYGHISNDEDIVTMMWTHWQWCEHIDNDVLLTLEGRHTVGRALDDKTVERAGRGPAWWGGFSSGKMRCLRSTMVIFQHLGWGITHSSLLSSLCTREELVKL